MPRRDHLRPMARLHPAAAVLAWLAAPCCAAADGADPPRLVHHDLAVWVEPADHHLVVHDHIAIPGNLVTAPLTVALNADFVVHGTSPTLVAAAAPSAPDTDGSPPVKVYAVDGAVTGHDISVDIDYEGSVDYPVQEPDARHRLPFPDSAGVISPQGVWLAGSTHWVPQAGDGPVTARLVVGLPGGWKSVSEGEGTGARGGDDTAGVTEVWSVTTPCEDLDLIAAPFTRYSRDVGTVEALAFLRTPDAGLADRYLEAAAKYLGMYQLLLGPYPYSKFALVENFLPTGYGMPSFTLLGDRVIRLPFILEQSYPHELLHNWWGNGVFVDHAGGNWSEGLTTYLADHLVDEQRGRGAVHRRNILQRVSGYVTAANDFPPSRFVSRSDAVSEAIGYGKTAMMWNMLRLKTGDLAFVGALRAFYHDNLFRAASYDDIESSFERASGRDLRQFFDQWVRRTGMPELRLDNVESHGTDLDITLSQVQGGPGFELDVPVAVATAAKVERWTVTMPAGAVRVVRRLALGAAPLRVEVDPAFDLYRRVSPLEVPPALSTAFGAEKTVVVMPARGGGVYSGLAFSLLGAGVHVVTDTAIDALPDAGAVWVFGSDNAFAPAVTEALRSSGASLDPAAPPYPAPQGNTAAPRSLVVAVRHPRNPASVVVHVSAPSQAAADALAGKLRHYGRYSWLVFEGDDAVNAGSGQWPVGDGPLARNLAPGAGPIMLPERRPLLVP